MYCPNCGQQQISEEIRFCSRCGLSLFWLADWLAGGSLPAKRVDESQVSAMSARRKGMRRAAKLMFFSGVLFPVFLLLSFLINEGGPMFFPCALFFVSLVMMLYARLFSDPGAPMLNRAAQTTVLGATPARTALPPASNNRLTGAGRQQVRTNELAQPSSVTEHTTRLLDSE